MPKLSTYAAASPASADTVPGIQGGANKTFTAGAIAELGAEVVEVTASETLALTRAGKFISANHATVAIAITVPPNSSVAFPVGTEIHVRQTGAAAVSFVQGSGVTINYPATQSLDLAERYAVATIKKMATDTWALFGLLGAA